MKTDFSYLEKMASDKKTRLIIKEIKEDRIKVRKLGQKIKKKGFFKLNLGKKTFFVAKNSASSTIDTYIEIFKQKGHLSVENFSGKDAKIIVDLGANEGYYTIAIKENNPDAKVIAVEPISSTFSILKKNIKANKLKNIYLFKGAIGSKNKFVEFEMYPGVSVIGAKDISMQKRPWVKCERIKKVKVKQITLEKLCKKMKIREIDILKLDVEGSEYEILNSSKCVLRNTKRIVLEWHSKKLRDNCKRFLKKQGFKVIFEEQRKCGDIYFENKSFS